MIRWFAKNDLAANLLMLCILIAGGIVAYTKVPLEVRPTAEYPIVKISIPFRGASAEEVERQVTIQIEQALEGLNGIDRTESISASGRSHINIYMKEGVDPKEKLQEIERRVREVNLPSETDTAKYDIPDTSNYFEVITVVVQAKHENYSLQELTKETFRLKNALLALPDVNRANVIGTSPREFAIRLSPEKVRPYGLSFNEISAAIRNNSKEVGAGTLKYETGRLTLKPGTTALNGEDFGNILINIGEGATILLKDIAEVNDGFSDELKEIEYLGKPALMVEILQNRDQSAITIANAVKDFVSSREEYQDSSPVNLYIWDDESFQIKERLKTLSTSLLQGGILVLVILGLFLRPALAFWVVIGIPISFAGGALFMPLFGITGNMMSIFAFILVLGIVVDDAIVTGENVYQHLQKGGSPLDATVKGTHEVTVPVIFGVLTTIVAFLPLYNFDGYWGTLAKQIPPIVATVLMFSLIESKLILPSHLKHLDLKNSQKYWYNKIPDFFNHHLSRFTVGIIKPAVLLCMKHRYITLTLFLSMGLACIGYWQSGKMGFQVFPSVESYKIRCILKMPEETHYKDTKKTVDRIQDAVFQLQDEFRDGEGAESPSLIKGIVSSAGGHLKWGYNERSGYILFEVLPLEERKHNFVHNDEIVKRLRELCGEMPENSSFYIRSMSRGSRSADDPDPVKISILGKVTPENKTILDRIEELIKTEVPKSELESIRNDRPATQKALTITLKEEGHRRGLTENDIAQQIRSSIIGTEITRLPRETGEIRVFLKFPDEVRNDRYALDSMLISTREGDSIPLSSVAEIITTTSPNRINRIDAQTVTSVIASPENKNYDLVQFADNITPKLNQLFLEYPGLHWAFDGYLADYKETRQKFIVGLIALSLTLYVLLALPFNSIVQPFYVMTAVPFGIVGAFVGHLIMDITPSYLSMFGVLALSGVVVNDSLVLVDTINRMRKEGINLTEAIPAAVVKRFRPILLTSLTTFVGLTPLIFAESIQAQFLIPMAVSLGFGIIFATFVTLLLVPAILLCSADLQAGIKSFKGWFVKPFKQN